MKIGILLPSEQQKAQAGVRIRYQRMEQALSRLGHQLELLPMQALTSKAAFSHDAYLISKCYDARAMVAARVIEELGKPVGVDLFDDYFSQTDDSRFVRLRYWLRALLKHSSYVLCSTPRMKELARRYAPALPVHVMNDPSAPHEPEKLADTMRRNLVFARENRRLNVAWFGIGDNPDFPVGLEDLAAYGGELARLRGFGFAVHLEILTNLRAMTPERLALLRRLPLPYTLEEWTEDRERELLERSLLCFLPVNAQSFSTVKSLNRAVTALSMGTQVLSAGYPLYQPFAELIYRDAETFMVDLSQGSLRLREETLPLLADRFAEQADVENEAAMFAAFLERQVLPSAKIPAGAGAAVIHGMETLGDVHKFAQRMGVLSVASPFAKAELNYDLRFRFAENGTGFDVLISSKKTDLLPPELRLGLKEGADILSTKYMKLETSTLFPDLNIRGAALAAMGSPCGHTAAYAPVMDGIAGVMSRLFPGMACFQAEQSKLLPWHVSANESGLTA